MEPSSCPDALQAERAARREAKRREKEERKVIREATRLRNALLCDQRAHVRIAAAEALYGAATLPAADELALAHEDNLGDSEPSGPVAPTAASLSGLDLKSFSLELLPSAWASLTSLDLSHNELSELPGIESLVSLTELDLCRNCFYALPPALRRLPKLAKLNASRNYLRPNADFLVLLLQPPGLPALQELDITFNKRCFTQDLADLLARELPSVAVRVTVTYPKPPGAFVGDAACDRDATLLRSQLEPFATFALRRRLVTTFGQEPYQKVGPSPPARAEVMKELLACYARAGCPNERRLLRVNGTPVEPDLLAELLVELRAWAARNEHHQERPFIHARTYMILRSPAEFEQKLSKGSSEAKRAKKKYDENERLWKLAASAMASVDRDFAAKFTGLAVTQGFRGSPHIDTTNIGPFYGLALGDFADGTGGIQVEVDPMTVAEVNTKHRLGKVDGRFPHWVAPYDESCERFSLIYYQTEGEVTPQTTAVFGPVLDGE
mmetsp:Transcript_71907/g.227220  ORF Transcript_71907/g.227220 Transcript_71907/m.227220 type:complete len:496 (-) Transcript_71907:41-1528(-)